MLTRAWAKANDVKSVPRGERVVAWTRITTLPLGLDIFVQPAWVRPSFATSSG